MKRLLLLLLWPFAASSQNTIGFPDVMNFSRQAYNAGLQNWDIRQDKNGIIYFANNEGLLSFDGKYWTLYPLPNKTIVRSIEIGYDNRIYVGGQDELGYFTPSGNGKLEYHSLTLIIPDKDKSFGDVWDIISFNKSVFFRSANKIFQVTNETVATYNASFEWSYLGKSNNRLYAHDFRAGIMGFKNNRWSPLFEKNYLPANDPVTSILHIKDDSSIITTLKSGLYSLSLSSISKIQTPNSALFENERVYAAVVVNKTQLALATNNSGVYIIDPKGNIVEHFNKTEGLQNNNVLSLFTDKEYNLWLGLDNGIAIIAYNSAIKQINPFLQDGSGYTAIIYNNFLYTGTSNGLYSVPLQPVNDLSFSRGNFASVPNTKGQVWSLAEINNQLLLGHHEGAFVIKNNSAIPLSDQPGFWNFTALTSTFPATPILAGNYKGLMFFDYSANQFISSAAIPGFAESSRFVTTDQDDNIWVSHPYHGIFKIVKDKNDNYSTYTFTEKQGLPSTLNNHVYKIKNQLVVATDKGVYTYNKSKNIFEPSGEYRKVLGEQSIRYLKDDMAGNIWFIHEKTLGVIDYSGKEPMIIYIPELKNKMLSGFEFIYPVDERNIFMGGEKGFYHINYEKYKQLSPLLNVRVSTVRIISNKDSVLFGGYFNNVNEEQLQTKSNTPEISDKWRTIHIEYSSPLYGLQNNLEYSYRLKGFDVAWSEWTKRTEKEYTNLPAGNYTFEIKVRNNLGNESETASYSFIILPPWYQSMWAKFLYLLLLAAAVFALYKWQQKKFAQQQKKYEEEQKKLSYIHELEINKTESELVAVRNEKLEADINFKNSELASSAMHLVKKGELLTKVKGELTQVIKRLDNDQAIGELKKMIKTLSEDENIDAEWENFAKHFDTVHSDFVFHLKEKHKDLSSNEVKLCAYLRMNLTTKEMAQLMNISVRGVEISRYRLRKKLNLPTEVNLFQYLFDLHKNNLK
jgi:DNA-binding CsgD family transcriptional regulator